MWLPPKSLDASLQTSATVFTHELQGIVLYQSPIGFTFEKTDVGPACTLPGFFGCSNSSNTNPFKMQLLPSHQQTLQTDLLNLWLNC